MFLDWISPSRTLEQTEDGRNCQECQLFINPLTVHQIAESLGRAVDAKHPATYAHSEEVAAVSHLVALRLGLSPHVAHMVHLAGHLHDIGKIRIPDAILHKPGPLSPHEMAVMRTHAEAGAAILEPVAVFRMPGGVVDIVRCHHERYDGSGYPAGLRGCAIPFGARIVAVADSLSAMLQERSYKKARSFPDAMAEIQSLAGVWYDPKVVAALSAIYEEVAHTLQVIRSQSRGVRPAGAASF
jgi:putative nucleotidyltransferase with HDIG domain